MVVVVTTYLYMLLVLLQRLSLLLLLDWINARAYEQLQIPASRIGMRGFLDQGLPATNKTQFIIVESRTNKMRGLSY